MAAALLSLAVAVSPALAKTAAQKKAQARSQFQDAQDMRQDLEEQPAGRRTPRDYRQVIDAYRRVYYLAPASNKADASVMAVADLLAEQGRLFHDRKSLQDAVGQYEFLRREYPGSRYRFEALLDIGNLYQQDLGDHDKAADAYLEFLRRYPHHELAAQARAALAQPTVPAHGSPPAKAQPGPEKSEAAEAPAAEETAVRPGRRPLVTTIRHFSTPEYSQVVIDLDSQVKFDSARVAHPDRIYFDLHDTRLPSALLGRTFEVENDPLLKKIRVAQFKPGETRVVLEVSDAQDYSATLLPNPYRLMVEIRGKKPATAVAQAAPAPPTVASAPRAERPAGAASGTVSAAAKPGSQETARAAEPAQAANTDASAPRAQSPERSAETGKALKTAAKARGIKAEANPQAKAAASKTEGEPISAPATNLSSQTPAPPVRATAGSAPPAKEAAASNSAPAKTTVARVVVPPDDEPPAAAKPVRRGKSRSRPVAADTDGREAQPTSSGERSLVRALGLKIGRIVVDAGHGGHDTGTIGPNGLTEKDLVLDVSLRLGKLLENRLGAEVTYTRDDDTFVPLEERTAIANQSQADLFISVHANSSRDASARGVETYYLNFTSSADALEVAARENAASDKSVHELQDLVKKIALKDKIEESREFAADVQQALYTGLASRNAGLRNRGVKKAPFVVLIGANMPSILAEISFVSNPTDARRLQSPEYRQKIAESLYRGIAKYASGLSGVKVAAAPKREAE